jgi:prepilin-type N-terminal cleavage/methylation domain-containing protein
MIANGGPAMRRRRRGFTLIELLVVISGVAVTLGVCVGVIHSLLKLDRAARAHLAETTAVGRLGHQFRQDVRASDRANPGPDRLELSLPDERKVEYEARPGALSRIERRGDEVVRRETYRVHRAGMPRFASQGEKDDVWVGLVLANDAETSMPGAGPSRAVRIEARLGNDRRLAVPGDMPR